MKSIDEIIRNNLLYEINLTGSNVSLRLKHFIVTIPVENLTMRQSDSMDNTSEEGGIFIKNIKYSFPLLKIDETPKIYIEIKISDYDDALYFSTEDKNNWYCIKY